MSSHYVPDTILDTLFPVIPNNNSLVTCRYYPHFTDEDIETQESKRLTDKALGMRNTVVDGGEREEGGSVA